MGFERGWWDTGKRDSEACRVSQTEDTVPAVPRTGEGRPLKKSETGGSYICGCGARFDFALGKYGCPNCCGDSGPAVFHMEA